MEKVMTGALQRSKTCCKKVRKVIKARSDSLEFCRSQGCKKDVKPKVFPSHLEPSSLPMLTPHAQESVRIVRSMQPFRDKCLLCAQAVQFINGSSDSGQMSYVVRAHPTQ
eukprot:4649814-Amphidinium_carterae.1